MEPRVNDFRPLTRPREPRVLVTIHLPLDMNVYADILAAVARGYPHAVIGERDGEVLEYPRPSGDR